MQQLSDVKTNTRTLNILKKKGLGTYDQFARIIPKRYFDTRTESGLRPEYDGLYVCVIGQLTDLKAMDNGSRKYLKATITDRISGKRLTVFWFFSGAFLKRKFEYCIGRNVIVYGRCKYDENWNSYSVCHPEVFSDEIEDSMRIIPNFGKITGISDENFHALMQAADYAVLPDHVPEEILERLKLPSMKETIWKLHHPQARQDIEKGYKRLLFDDLLYFAIYMKGKGNEGTYPQFADTDILEKLQSFFPYVLTEDQSRVCNALSGKMQQGECVDALVQGDVGCGKTSVIMMMAFLCAANGYQAAIMAPTEILASQHYEEIRSYVEKCGLNAVYVNGKMKAKEKTDVLKKIEDGRADIVIGTHAITGENIRFKNLGLAIVDEEQRFGVAIKEELKKKGNGAVHYMALSATPIPRTMADIIFGEDKQVFDIKSMPAGRKPVETTCITDFSVPKILEKEVLAGRQAYVICPKIASEEEEEGENKKLYSVEETFRTYEKYFAEKGIKCGTLVGNKSGRSQDEQVMDDFQNNRIQILIATTVVEVGVNNPNASVIVVQNAERFGLSTLHQLRGRVKRGKHKPYCILISKDGMEKERLALLCETEDGFKIAEADLQFRQSGNLMGMEQSGKNKYVQLACRYPNMYKTARKVAGYMKDNKTDKAFTDYMDMLLEKEVSRW